MTTYEIPLTPGQNQKLSISLAGTVYELTFKWVDAPEGGWALDISDSGDNPILQGIPLVTGADLLAQYAYLGIGGALVVQSDGAPSAPPTFDNLGQQGHLYFLTAS